MHSKPTSSIDLASMPKTYRHYRNRMRFKSPIKMQNQIQISIAISNKIQPTHAMPMPAQLLAYRPKTPPRAKYNRSSPRLRALPSPSVPRLRHASSHSMPPISDQNGLSMAAISKPSPRHLSRSRVNRSSPNSPAISAITDSFRAQYPIPQAG